MKIEGRNKRRLWFSIRAGPWGSGLDASRLQKDKQYKYKVTLRLLRVSTVALEKQWVLHILIVYLQP